MEHLKEWLDSVDEHFKTVSAEELEQRYLAVRDGDGHGVTIEEFLQNNPEE